MEAEFWVAAAFVIFVIVLGYFGAHKRVVKGIDDRRDRIKAEPIRPVSSRRKRRRFSSRISANSAKSNAKRRRLLPAPKARPGG